MNKPLFSAACALLGACLLVANAEPSRADVPVKSLYVGIHGGGLVPLDDWDIGSMRQFLPEAGGVVGLRVGLHLTWWLAAELDIATNAFSDSSDGSNLALNISGDLLFHLTRGDWVPLLHVGGGAFIMAAGELESDADYHIHWGLGVRGRVLDWLAIRVDARHILGDPGPTDAIFANLLEVTAGLDFYAWQEDHTPPDTDKDGVADPDDGCPKVPGPAATGGCPDADGDGVADGQDACPKVAGKGDLKGCPDSDGDGIADADDACPQAAGKAAFKGCPDSDGDGFGDAEDKCPRQSGEKEFGGCPPPDGDKDGIADRDDACPKIAGVAAQKGCPDSDADGIRDQDDRCPKTPGVAEEQGCLPKAAQVFTGAIKGIRFKSGSAKLRKSSFATLRKALKILKKWPTIRIRVEGHTDDKGSPESNLILSDGRAQSVVKWFTDQGIDPKRLVARGYGEERPIAPNTSSSGRAKNRRIVFTVLGKE